LSGRRVFAFGVSISSVGVLTVSPQRKQKKRGPKETALILQTALF
jgi:hypothetical protein